MIQISFSQVEQNDLFKGFREAKSGNVSIRFLALYLKSLGISHQTIGEICRISRPTLVSYFELWEQGGQAELASLNFVRHSSKLLPFSDEVKKYFEEHPPQNSSEAKEKIMEITGIERSPTQIRVFMNAIGMKIRKVGFVPGKASTLEKQKGA